MSNSMLSDTFMPSLIWNTNPNQMMMVVNIMMRLSTEMGDDVDWGEYWKRAGFIKE